MITSNKFLFDVFILCEIVMKVLCTFDHVYVSFVTTLNIPVGIYSSINEDLIFIIDQNETDTNKMLQDETNVFTSLGHHESSLIHEQEYKECQRQFHPNEQSLNDKYNQCVLQLKANIHDLLDCTQYDKLK